MCVKWTDPSALLICVIRLIRLCDFLADLDLYFWHLPHWCFFAWQGSQILLVFYRYSYLMIYCTIVVFWVTIYFFFPGKSNLMDAISFVLGEKTSNLRVRRLNVGIKYFLPIQFAFECFHAFTILFYFPCLHDFPACMFNIYFFLQFILLRPVLSIPYFP